MTEKLEQQYQRYVYQYKMKEARYGAEAMADTMLTKSEFETQMIRVRNTSHANIKAAKEKLEKEDISESEREELQVFEKKNRNILKNPIRSIVERQTYSASKEWAKSIQNILSEAGEEVPTIEKIRTTKKPTETIFSETLKEAMRKRYAKERNEGASPKMAASRVWRSFGGSPP